MTTKAKRATKTRGVVPPLTRKQRATIKEARRYGVDAFGYRTEIPNSRGITKTLAIMGDTERQLFFDLLESFCELGESLRGVN